MSRTTIGVDLGGTNIRAGRVTNGEVERVESVRIADLGSEEEILDAMTALIGQLSLSGIEGIGIGVPSMVDEAEGVVYDVQNLPGWNEVPLGAIIEQRFGCPVHVNNDTNCFALAEYRMGKGRGLQSMIALNIGTGVAGGVILDGTLYSGRNGAAGEFGTVPFKSGMLEHYCGGTFFERTYKTSGEKMAERAGQGDLKAHKAFNEYGRYLGFAIKMILYNYDPEAIILGGSVSRSYRWFEESMKSEIGEDFAYPKCLEELTIDVSELDHAGVVGASILPLEQGRERTPL